MQQQSAVILMNIDPFAWDNRRNFCFYESLIEDTLKIDAIHLF